MFKNFEEIFEHLKGVGRTPIIVVGEDKDAVWRFTMHTKLELEKEYL